MNSAIDSYWKNTEQTGTTNIYLEKKSGLKCFGIPPPEELGKKQIQLSADFLKNMFFITIKYEFVNLHLMNSKKRK